MQNTPAHPETSPAGAEDPRCIPHKLTVPLPVGSECPYPDYTNDEQDVWRTLYARMQALLPGRAADEFLVGLKALDLEDHRIPALAEVFELVKRKGADHVRFNIETKITPDSGNDLQLQRVNEPLSRRSRLDCRSHSETLPERRGRA